MSLRKIKKFFLDLFFPKKCLGCGKSDTYLCADCFSLLTAGQTIPNIERQKNAYLDKIIFATNYGNPLIRELIKSFKYQFVRELAIPLSQLLIKALNPFKPVLNTQNSIIVPVPLHKFRLRNRGFNQAELLAKEVADYFNLLIKTDVLQRIKPTEIQAEIKNDEQRKANVENAFKIADSEAIQGKIVLLIDDVITSAATLSEAGKILKTNGAKEVWALTVAKG